MIIPLITHADIVGDHPMTPGQLAELVNLYHLARTALAGEQDQGRWARMRWAAASYHDANPGTTKVRAYKILSRALQ